MLLSGKGFTLSAVFFLWFSVLSAAVPARSTADPIYKYTDDSGTQNFTTDLNSIPQKYRSQIVSLGHESSPASPPAIPSEPPAPSANVRVVTASGEYRMGDHDTRADAVRLAVEAAKREALEQVATYLESVTEVKNMDVTRDDIRTYTAGIVMILDQKITTGLEGETVVIHADLTAQVDPNEVAQAITALRENESAKNELAALRAETDQLHQQLDAANEALATASSPEQIQGLSQQRQDVLNQLQTNALVSQAWTDWVYVTPVIYPYPWIGVQQVHGLLLQAQHLYPRNRHLTILQQVVTTQAGALPPPPPGVSSPVPPHSSLLVPPPASLRIMPQQGFSRPLPPTLQQIHPPHVAQPNPPVLRAPYSVPRNSPSMSPRHFGGGGHSGGGGGGHSGGGGRSGGGGGHRGR